MNSYYNTPGLDQSFQIDILINPFLEFLCKNYLSGCKIKSQDLSDMISENIKSSLYNLINKYLNEMNDGMLVVFSYLKDDKNKPFNRCIITNVDENKDIKVYKVVRLTWGIDENYDISNKSDISGYIEFVLKHLKFKLSVDKYETLIKSQNK